MSNQMAQLQEATIKAHCKSLRMPMIATQFGSLAEQAIREKRSHIGYLEALLLAEIEERERNTIERRIKQVHLPRVKALEEFDYAQSPNVTAAKMRDLAEGGYIERAEPVLFIGECGSGKTHLLTGICVAACRQKRRVRFTTRLEAQRHARHHLFGHRSSLDLSRKHAAFYPGEIQRSRPDLGGTVAEAQDRIAKNVKLSPGYRLVWAGEFGDLQEAKKRLEIIVSISFILIAGALYSLFNNFRDSILALAGIPFAIVGGILALYTSGLNFSISAAIGFVSLFGVSVIDGILMITFYNQERANGLAPADAMYRAATTRMPPFDDGAFRLHRTLSRSDFDGHWKPGAAAPRYRDRWGHVGWPGNAAARCPGAAADLPRRWRKKPASEESR